MTIREQNEIVHYNEIPAKYLGKKILDVGCGDCFGAYFSKHQIHFCTNEYLGIDINPSLPYLPSTIADIRTFTTTQKYDTIIMSHILEHFSIEQWENILSRFVGFLEPKGFLIINVPYKQKKAPKVDSEYMRHKTLNINKKLLSRFLPIQRFLFGYDPEQDRVKFKNKNENLLKALARFVYRIFTNHSYSILKTWRKKPLRLIGIYQK